MASHRFLSLNSNNNLSNCILARNRSSHGSAKISPPPLKALSVLSPPAAQPQIHSQHENQEGTKYAMYAHIRRTHKVL
jgi:hypothetical protein